MYLLNKGMFNFDFGGVKGLVLPCVCVCASNIDVFLWFGLSLELHFVNVSAHIILVQNVSDLSFKFLSFWLITHIPCNSFSVVPSNYISSTTKRSSANW